MIESALARQHLEAKELTSYYLVDLLCRFVRPGRADSVRRRPAEPAGAAAEARARQPPAWSSGRGCATSAISRCSCPASSPTACAGAPSTSTTTSRWGSTPTASLSRARRGRVRRGVRRARPANSSRSWTSCRTSANAHGQPRRRTAAAVRAWLRTGSPGTWQSAGRNGAFPERLDRSADSSSNVLHFSDARQNRNPPTASKSATTSVTGLPQTHKIAKLQGFITGIFIA